MTEDVSIGVVRWFNDQRGFGFITPNDGGEDLFVHHSSIQSDGYRSLTVGHEVEFQVFQDDSGRFKAIDVRNINGSPIQDRFNTRIPRTPRGNGFSTRPPFRSGGGGRSFNGGGYSYTGGGGGGGRGSNGGGYSYTGGGGGGGNGSGVCFNCRRPGHFARDCPLGGGGSGGGGGCYQCGEVGHLARECHNGVGGGGGGGGGGGTGACFNCGELGHMARECTQSGGGGGGGGGVRGFSTRMGGGGGGGGGGCFNCGKPGHFARECTEVPE